MRQILRLLIGYESHTYWNQYSKFGLKELVDLRITDANLVGKVKPIISDYAWDGREETGNRIAEILVNSLIKNGEPIALILNLHYKHWVGMIVQNKDGKVAATYMDSETNAIPEALTTILRTYIQAVDYEFTLTEQTVEQQLSNNCGPELIENLILYLTGSRVAQEQAVQYHSYLLEKKLLTSRELIDNTQVPSEDSNGIDRDLSFNNHIASFIMPELQLSGVCQNLDDNSY